MGLCAHVLFAKDRKSRVRLGLSVWRLMVRRRLGVIRRLVIGRLVIGRLVIGRLVIGRLVIGRLVIGRLVFRGVVACVLRTKRPRNRDIWGGDGDRGRATTEVFELRWTHRFQVHRLARGELRRPTNRRR